MTSPANGGIVFNASPTTTNTNVFLQLGTGTGDQGGSGGIWFGTKGNSSTPYIYQNGAGASLAVTAGNRGGASLQVAGAVCGTSMTGITSGLGGLNTLGAITFPSVTTGAVVFTAATGTLTNAGFTFNAGVQFANIATASAPTGIKGLVYYDTTLNKLRVYTGSVYETITSA